VGCPKKDGHETNVLELMLFVLLDFGWKEYVFYVEVHVIGVTMNL
jgi:hypothetical protein